VPTYYVEDFDDLKDQIVGKTIEPETKVVATRAKKKPKASVTAEVK
jgi:hypothetical protein